MSESYRALCSDFYVNQKLTVKMDLPRGRDSVLDLFERTRKQFPSMTAFRKYRDELSLDSPPPVSPQRWLSLRSTNVRSGCVNPETLEEAYALHRHVLETAPYFLNISPLDIDSLELLYGFDLAASGNHDAMVFEALLAGSPLMSVADVQGLSPVSCQPLITMALGDRGDIQVEFKVETRSSGGTSREHEGPSSEPISVYLSVRKVGPVKDVKELAGTLATLARHGEELVDSRLVPRLLVPLRQVIGMGNA